MVSTVTDTEISVAAQGLLPLLGAVAVVGLLVFLIQRELAAAAGPRWQTLARHLVLPIVPLLIVFAAIVTSRLFGLT